MIPGAVTEYSSICPFNADNSKLVLILGGDHFALYSIAGEFIRDLPISASSEPRWSATNSDLLYFHDSDGVRANELWTLNADSGEVRIVHTFDESFTFGKGEGDLSEDGDHLGIVTPSQVFLYSISLGTSFAPLLTTDHFVESVYVTPDNNLLVSWGENGPDRFQGIELFSSNSTWLRQVMTCNSHKARTRDVDGSEIVVLSNSDENPVTLRDFQNGVIKIPLATGKQTGLLELPWVNAVHITAPHRQGWVIVETYQDPSAATGLWSGQLIQVFLDGRPPVTLAHHGSIVRSYGDQPKATISRDGGWLAYTSNASGALGTYILEVAAPPLLRTIEDRVTELERWRASVTR